MENDITKYYAYACGRIRMHTRNADSDNDNEKDSDMIMITILPNSLFFKRVKMFITCSKSAEL